MSGDHPPHLVLDGRSVLVTADLLLIAGYRMPPDDPSVRAEHVVLSTKTLRRLATVDYGFPADTVRLIGSADPGSWLTIDRGGIATVWATEWPLVPISRGDGRQRPRAVAVSHVVEHHVDVLHHGGEVLDRVVDAEFGQEGVVGGPGGADHVRAVGLGDLRRDVADASRGRVHEDPVAGTHPGDVDQRLPHGPPCQLIGVGR